MDMTRLINFLKKTITENSVDAAQFYDDGNEYEEGYCDGRVALAETILSMIKEE